MERNIIVALYDQMSKSNCKCCCKNCSTKKLLAYIDSVGGPEKFHTKYEDGTVPLDITILFNQKVSKFTLL